MHTRWMLSLALALGLAACAEDLDRTSEHHDPSGVVGRFVLPLITESGGETYRLVGTIALTGPIDLTLDLGAVNGATLERDLPAGQYELRLVEGWQLQRRVEDTYERVSAVLRSIVDGAIEIRTGRTTTVRLGFTLPTGEVSFDGTLAVELEVVASCDLLDPTACAAPEACYPIATTPPTSSCARVASFAGGVGEACRFVNGCLAGLACIFATPGDTDGSCRDICDVSADDCPNGATCAPLNIGFAGYCP